MELPEQLHDGDLIKVGKRCWAEYIKTPATDYADERVSFRLTDHRGFGTTVESYEEIDKLIKLLQLVYV